MSDGIQFGKDASFTSIVSRLSNAQTEDGTTIEQRLRSMKGPAQPAMNPGEIVVVPNGQKTAKYPNDDPKWNGPAERI